MSAGPSDGLPADRPSPAADESAGDPRRPEDDLLAEARRRRRRAEIFGDVLPDVSSDERSEDASGSDSARSRGDASEDWLRRQVPPHHG